MGSYPMSKVSECFRPLPPERFFLTRYCTETLPERIDAFQYRVMARRLAARDEASILARLALRLSRSNDGIPVVRLSGKTLVSLEALENLELDEKRFTIEPIDASPLAHRSTAGRRALIRLVRGYVKRAAARHGFIAGVSDFILSPRFRLTDSKGIMALQTGVVFELSLGPANALVLDCDMKSKILRQQSLKERLESGEISEPRGLMVSSLVDSETFEVEAVLDRTVSERDRKLGCSVLQYNQRLSRYPASLDPDPSSPVVACRVGERGRVYHYDSQLLHETLDLKSARRIDRDFAAELAEATRLDTSERERFCSYFVDKVKAPGPDWLRFVFEPAFVGRRNTYRAFDVALPADNIVFGQERHHSSIEKGLLEHGLFSSPGVVKLGVLLPSSREKGAATVLEKALDGLASVCPGVPDFQVVYEGHYQPKNPFRIKGAVDELVSSEAEMALVLLPGRGQGSPYHLLKGELARHRFPSQMLHLDTSLSRRELVNLLVGFTAKIGRSENWRIGKLLWPPDIFVGISSERIDEERMAAVATAFSSTGRALDVTVEVFANASPIIPESRLLHLLEGAFLAYRNKFGILPAAAVLHRDGPFQESSYGRVWKHFQELGVSLNLVAIDVGLPPRIGCLRGDAKESPPPGTLVVTGEDQGLLITSGAPIGGRGCPRPIGFERVMGRIDICALAGHIFWLSRAHVGSIRPPRLPVTIHFARKVVGLVREGLVPQGTMGSRMLFV